jgi:hypothetical protein
MATLASSFVITVPAFFVILLVLRRWTQVRTQQQETIWHQVNRLQATAIEMTN